MYFFKKKKNHHFRFKFDCSTSDKSRSKKNNQKFIFSVYFFYSLGIDKVFKKYNTLRNYSNLECFRNLNYWNCSFEVYYRKRVKLCETPQLAKNLWYLKTCRTKSLKNTFTINFRVFQWVDYVLVPSARVTFDLGK